MQVRNNVLLVLSDLCVQYTSLVDRFVGMMTGCLTGKHELLRKHAVMVLSHLLSEDFIKFKGSIQHRFLYVLADPSENVTEGLVEAQRRVLEVLFFEAKAFLVKSFVAPNRLDTPNTALDTLDRYQNAFKTTRKCPT